jgi:hypothetical protein
MAASGHVPDGYDEEERGERRAIIGAFVKFADGTWYIGGVPIDADFRPIVIDLDHGLQRWQGGQLVEERFTKPLDDVDELNAKIPRAEWDQFPNGEPKPPWSHAFKFYLLDDKTGTRATFVTNSVGGGICYAELKDKVVWMRKMRGPGVLPRVQPTTAAMRTRYSPHPKKRPDLKIVGYVTFTSGGFVPLPSANAPQLQKVAEPTVAEDLNDRVPF